MLDNFFPKIANKKIGMLVLSFFFILLLHNVTIAPISAAENIDDLGLYIEQQRQKSIIPGISVGMIHEGEIIFSKGYGKANNQGDLITNRSIFNIAGLSKSITAMGILALYEDGDLNLTDPIQLYIPTFEVANSDYASQITIEDCLYHISGLSIDSGELKQKNQSLEEIVAALSDEKLIAAPGTTVEYSNSNYHILGLIIERITGQSFEEFIQTRILTPLGMNHTYFTQTTAKDDENFAQGYRIWYGFTVPSNLQHDTQAAPSDGMASSLEDLLMFLRAHMYPTNSNFTNNVISPSSFRILHALPENNESFSPWAMGWSNFTYEGDTYLTQSGDLNDYHSEIIIDVNGDYGVIVLSNVNSFFGNMGYYKNLAINMIGFVEARSVISPRLSHFILYILLDLVMITSLVRDILKTVKVKSQTQKKLDEKISPKEKKQYIIIDIAAEFLAIILFILLLPLLIGVLANISGFTLTFLAQLQPDIFTWIIVISAVHLVKAIGKIILFKDTIAL